MNTTLKRNWLNHPTIACRISPEYKTVQKAIVWIVHSES